MNIFVTDTCPIKSAQDHNNVHNVKMIIEVSQLLSTAHFELDGVIVGYKPTHRNHPSAIWVRACSGNYKWLYAHFKALCDEFEFRKSKVHKTSELISVLDKLPENIIEGELESFVMAMPEEYKKLGIFDQTKAYRAYLNDKFAEWACREKPIAVDWGNRKQPEWVEL